ncbi:MAG: ATP-binding protein, partial [Pseudomonadota bacterium]|nr:ATP-binding protein [Pseudomonadota bacterium]
GRMACLVDGLSELSRVTTAQLAPAPVDLTLLAEWALAELQEDEPDRALDATVQPDLVVHGDERLLKTLMTHLLRNAWIFSRDREVVFIRVEGEADARGLRLSVHDHGRGIDMRYADKLFQPFQRQHGEELGGGAALGLAVVQRIVQRHGGRAWAESEVDVGSVFHVWLPGTAEK